MIGKPATKVAGASVLTGNILNYFPKPSFEALDNAILIDQKWPLGLLGNILTCPSLDRLSCTCNAC